MSESRREAEPVEKCPVCTAMLELAEKAAREYDRSAETDARVKLRRHARAAHGRELPLPW